MRGLVVAFACLSGLVLWLGPGVASSSGAPQCRTAQLSMLQAGVDGGLSHEGLVLRLTNRSSRPCLIGGYVGLLRLNVHRRPVHTVVHRGSGYLFPSSRPHNIILAPGHSVFAGVEWLDGPVDSDPASCTSAGHDLEVTPPNETTHVDLCAHECLRLWGAQHYGAPSRSHRPRIRALHPLRSRALASIVQ
jgi:hypothetical protein